mgnify:CR=1 FL=1
MPELSAVLKSSRDKEHEERKFLAAIQGIDLDKNTDGGDAWENLKARVASGGKAKDSNDILSLQGAEAAKAGFGINMGIDFEDLTAPAESGGEE